MRVSHLTRSSAPSRRSRGAPGRAARARSRGRRRGSDEVLRLAARALARGEAVVRGDPPRRGDRRRTLSSSCPYAARRVHARSSSTSDGGFDQDAYTIFGLVVQSGGPETAGRIATLAAGLALLAGRGVSQLHPRPRRRARPVADRVARLLRGRPRAVGRRPAAALARLVPRRSRRGGVEGAGIGTEDAAGPRGAARPPRRPRPRVRRRAAAAGQTRRMPSSAAPTRARGCLGRGQADLTDPTAAARVRRRGPRSSAPAGTSARAARDPRRAAR